MVLTDGEKKAVKAVMDELIEKEIKTNWKTVKRYLEILCSDNLIKSEKIILSKKINIEIYFSTRKTFPKTKYL